MSRRIEQKQQTITKSLGTPYKPPPPSTVPAQLPAEFALTRERLHDRIIPVDQANAPPRVPPRVKIRGTKKYAGMVELTDTLDLGAVTSVKVFTRSN